jgi:hypothetical protein
LPSTLLAVSERFTEGAEPVQNIAIQRRDPPEPPLVLVVVDDSGDDELVTAMAEASDVPARGYDATWDAVQTNDGSALKLRLIRMADAWECAWTYDNPPQELVEAITGGPHHVAIIPQEFAPDPQGIDLRAAGGAVIVQVELPPPAAAALRALCGF